MELPLQQLAEVFARTVQPDRVNSNTKLYKNVVMHAPMRVADDFPATTDRK
jgi:hypothetical protein